MSVFHRHPISTPLSNADVCLSSSPYLYTTTKCWHLSVIAALSLHLYVTLTSVCHRRPISTKDKKIGKINIHKIINYSLFSTAYFNYIMQMHALNEHLHIFKQKQYFQGIIVFAVLEIYAKMYQSLQFLYIIKCF